MVEGLERNNEAINMAARDETFRVMNQGIGASKKHITWIDSLKGIAIIMVVLQHVGFGNKEYFAWYHIGQSVPLFLFCTAFLLGNRETKKMYEWSRCWETVKKIFGPFFLCTVIQVAILMYRQGTVDASHFVYGFLYNGGFGPGSYYPWMYMQFWLFIPIIKWLNDNAKGFYTSLFLTALLCAVMELAFIFVADTFFEKEATSIWRLTFIRYGMLIWIGINFTKIIEKKVFCVLAVVLSVVLATIDLYFYDLHSYGWNGYHWFTCFFVIVMVLLFKRVDYPILRTIGRHSWDVFLIQMAYFSIIDVQDQRSSLYKLFSIVSIALISYILIEIKEKTKKAKMLTIER